MYGGQDGELGRHRGRNDDRQCKLCGEECESVVHVLWERVDAVLREREYREFNEGLNSKVKLSLYKSFCKEIEFKNYLWYHTQDTPHMYHTLTFLPT